MRAPMPYSLRCAALLAGLCCVHSFSVPALQPCARKTPAPVMIDSDVVVGAGLLFGGAAFGAGFIAFVEKQGERTNERGGMSDETRSSIHAHHLLRHLRVPHLLHHFLRL